MQLIPISTNHGIQPAELDINQNSFKELNLKESDVEEFIRKNTDLIFEEEETLLIVGQQVHNQQRGISDLIAIDENGSLVLIEIKRDLEDIKNRKEPFEFQAIRYAASCAKMHSPEDLVDKIFIDYIEKHRGEFELGELTPREKGLRVLMEFLKQNDAQKTFNQKQRILLIASSFDPQTESAVAWLISNGVDISCFSLCPISIGDNCFLQLDKILPVPSLDDYFIDITGSTLSKQYLNSKKSTKRTNLPRMKKLFEWELVHRNDKIRIKNFEDSEATVIDEKHVTYNGDKLTFNQWGQKVTGWSAICIYEWAMIVGEEKTLHEKRIKKMEELEEQSN